MSVTVSQLKRISLSAKPNDLNMRSIVAALSLYGERFGLTPPHRLAHYLAQLAHESGHFGYDAEIWRDTPAQQRYDTRTDLGNTPAKDGDGKKYKGRTGIQLTGRANYTAFYEWCVSEGLNPPDFVEDPDLVNTDPWEGLVPIWFWSKGNRTGKSLNIYADRNDIEMCTRIINGGKNGFEERLTYYTRAALVLLDYNVGKGSLTSRIHEFQVHAGLKADGIDGPQTRAALHKALVKFSPAVIRKETTAAPVVEEKKVAVSTKEATKPKKDYIAMVITFLSGGGASFVGDLSKEAQIILVLIASAAIGYLFWSRRNISVGTRELKENMED